jgi:tetratricopeptide (TPR) repeat protein
MRFCVWGARFPPLSGALFFPLLLAACSAPQTRALSSLPESFPARAELTQTPFFPQEQFQCGPAALATTLSASGIAVTPEQLTPQVYLPGRQGSLQIEMLAAARRNGTVPALLDRKLSTLLQTVAEGYPVVVLQNLGLSWVPRWHYAVVIGYDLDAGRMVLRSGATRRLSMSISTFERTWARSDYWAIVTPAPGDIPRHTVEKNFLASAVAFEKQATPAQRIAVYEAATQRWPANALAWMGLGNGAFEIRDWTRAERAFRKAAALSEDRVPALNNLALALEAQGRIADAIAVAEQAVAAGGPFAAAAKATLAQLRARHEETGGDKP